jgi:RNA polymerase sigma-70 factor (ECF subfamily)
MTLLEPIHESAVMTARRLSRTSGEGDDLYQEALLQAFRKLPSLRDESRFRSWFFAVLLSLHRSHSRRAFWKRFLPLEESSSEHVMPGWSATEQDEAARADRASKALALLPAVQREAIVLFEMNRYSIAEIAQLQNVSESAVKSRLARARERLRGAYRRMERTEVASERPKLQFERTPR